MKANYWQGEFPEPKQGTYVLILYLVAPGRLVIGQLGAFDFPDGWYAYVGSALHASGLRGRLKHHLSPISHPHWHIDYLRQEASVEQIWYYASLISHEHVWASLLGSQMETDLPVPRFGASDCKCLAHLFHFKAYPDFDKFRALVHLQGDVVCWEMEDPEATPSQSLPAI